MAKRTAEEVAALWPAKPCRYTFLVQIVCPQCKTTEEVAEVLGGLYACHEAMGGSFHVKEMSTAGKFMVDFHRDTAEDSEVVEDKLLRGDPFEATLLNQFVRELMEARRCIGRPFIFEVQSGPVFSSY